MQKIHTVVRSIWGGATVKDNTTELFNSEETEAYLNDFLGRGWKLFAVHYLGVAEFGGTGGKGRTFSWTLLKDTEK